LHVNIFFPQPGKFFLFLASVKKRHPLTDIHIRTRDEDEAEKKLVQAIVDKVIEMVEEKLRLSTR